MNRVWRIFLFSLGIFIIDFIFSLYVGLTLFQYSNNPQSIYANLVVVIWNIINFPLYIYGILVGLESFSNSLESIMPFKIIMSFMVIWSILLGWLANRIQEGYTKKKAKKFRTRSN